jgi:large subunit ribosomal protein L17
MRHLKAFRKLSRTSSHRAALFRTMTTQLVIHERIRTTVPKAKELRRLAEQMVTKAKEGTEQKWREVTSFVRTIPAASKLFTILAPR